MILVAITYYKISSNHEYATIFLCHEIYFTKQTMIRACKFRLLLSFTGVGLRDPRNVNIPEYPGRLDPANMA